MNHQLLHEILDADAEAAASPDTVVAVRDHVLHPVRRRRRPVFRVSLAAVAAAAIAGLVVAIFVAARPARAPVATPPPPAAATMSRTAWQVTVDPDPEGVPFAWENATTVLQYGNWAKDPNSFEAMLQVTVPVGGRPLPARPADATDVAVAGTTGWTVTLPHDSASRDDIWRGLLYGLAGAGTLTVWTDAATGLTVSIATEHLSAARVAQLAATVHVGATHPIRVPFRATWLPPGVDPDMVNVQSDGQSGVTFTMGASSFYLSTVRTGKYPSGIETRQPRTAPFRLGPYDVDYRPTSAESFLTIGTTTVEISWGPGGRTTQNGPATAMPLDQFTRFVDGLTVADLADPSGWFDLSDTVVR